MEQAACTCELRPFTSDPLHADLRPALHKQYAVPREILQLQQNSLQGVMILRPFTAQCWQASKASTH